MNLIQRDIFFCFLHLILTEKFVSERVHVLVKIKKKKDMVCRRRSSLLEKRKWISGSERKTREGNKGEYDWLTLCTCMKIS